MLEMENLKKEKTCSAQVKQQAALIVKNRNMAKKCVFEN